MSSPFELPGFEPVRKVGGGGFGDVWLARQTNVDRQVAIKVGHAPIQDETIKLRFDRECKALGRLSGHPNIVGVFTAGSLADGRPYLVLEYVDGGTLWQRLKRSPLTDLELIDIGRELAAALEAAHTSGVLHRDLKPENILIRSSGGAVLGDFGIARLQDGANTTSASITASVAYAAPEVLSGKKATAATDLYGIGVCLLAAAIRSVPFVEKSDESIQPILKRVLNDRHPDLALYGVKPELANLIDRLVKKDPEDRPQTAAEVMAEFTQLRTRISGPVELAGLSVPSGPGQPLSGDATDSVSPGLPPAGPTDPAGQPLSGVAAAGPAAASAGANSPAPGPNAVPGAPPPYPADPSADIRTFLIAYTVTVLVGGVLLLLLL